MKMKRTRVRAPRRNPAAASKTAFKKLLRDWYLTGHQDAANVANVGEVQDDIGALFPSVKQIRAWLLRDIDSVVDEFEDHGSFEDGLTSQQKVMLVKAWATGWAEHVSKSAVGKAGHRFVEARTKRDVKQLADHLSTVARIPMGVYLVIVNGARTLTMEPSFLGGYEVSVSANRDVIRRLEDAGMEADSDQHAAGVFPPRK